MLDGREGGLQLRLAVGDEVTAGGDKGLDALGPQGGDDVGGARAPVEAGEDGLVDLEGVHQGDDVERDGGLLRGAGSVPGQEAGAAVSAQVGNDDAVTLVGEERGYVDEAVDVVGPAVQEEDDRAVGGTGLGVADVQDPALTCLIVPNSVWVPGVTAGTVGMEAPPGSCAAVAADALVCRPDSETAAAPVPRLTALLKVRLLIM